MKNRVDPEIPLVKVLPNNAALQNGGLKQNSRKRRTSAGQFSISNVTSDGRNPKEETQENQISTKNNVDLFLSSTSTKLREEISQSFSYRQIVDNTEAGKRKELISTNGGNPARKAVSKWKNFVSTRRCKLGKLRPFEEINMKQLCKTDLNKRNGINDECFGFLEETLDNLEKSKYGKNQSMRRKQAKKKALISYFVDLASHEDEQANVDLNLVEELLESGADINMGDRYGQTVLHEVARIWHPDVAQFLIERGARVDGADQYGRTPLHVASAVDYSEMVNFLVSTQADVHARTLGECQSPIHYAAKNDACNSLVALIENGASIEDTDFKGRTPLQVAAELDRSETCKILLNEGAPAGVWDHSGMSAITLMILKMPPVALKALDQFHVKDRANRKQYFYLNYLETPTSLPNNAKSCLKVAVEEKQYAIIMHPVMQRLTETKWNLFGKTRASMNLLLNLFFCVIWTVILCIAPNDHKDLYSPLPQKSYRIVLEAIAIFSVLYWFLSELKEYRASLRERDSFLNWRENELTRDMEHCHPRWPEERAYLEREIAELGEVKPSYFVDWWNYYDMLTYGFVLATVISHVVAVTRQSKSSFESEKAIGAIMLILQWTRLMKFVRAFHALGPFVVILRHVFSDTARFAFLFFEFYIPYLAAMWILFGSESVPGYSNIEELFFNLLQITVIGDYGFSDLAKKHGRMARLLCGTYIVLSGIVCLNLFIALLSDTFQRVYDNAKANAQMLRAARVLNFEDNFAAKRREKFQKHIQLKCAPEVLYYDDDMNDQSDAEVKRMTHQIKQDLDKMNKYLQVKLGDTDDEMVNPADGDPAGSKPVSNADVVNLAQELNILKSNYEHSMRIVNIQLLSMNSMLAELTKRKKKKIIKREGKLSKTVIVTGNGRKLSSVIPMGREAQTSERGASIIEDNLSPNGSNK